jgi:ABC-type protease/lipase transport system fused ATPase/permease subunit
MSARIAATDVANDMQQTVIYVMGPDIQAILDTPTRVPVVEILFRITGSIRATAVLTCLVGLLFICCLTNNVTTGSRQLW